MTIQKADTIQMVISLPFELLERTERLVDQGLAGNREALLRAAIERFVTELEERISIETRFSEMAEDAEFQALNLQVAEEFAISDYEAFKLGENETR